MDDTNDFGEPVICKDCGASIHPLAVFPGSRCLECHAKRFDAQQLPTANEITGMFRAAVKAR